MDQTISRCSVLKTTPRDAATAASGERRVNRTDGDELVDAL